MEHDLRAKLLRLRQKASGILSDKDVLRRLLVDSVSTFCVLFRHALILHGVAAPARKREIIAAARRDSSGSIRRRSSAARSARRQKLQAEGMEPELLLAAYMKEIEKVIDAVDRLEIEGNKS